MSPSPTDSSSTPHEAVAALVARLETAWNQGDSDAFAAEFASDADFVNVRGEHASGRDAIARGHAEIWNSIYAGSTVRYSITRLRELVPGVVLVHLDADLHVPAGPAAGRSAALPSLVVVSKDGHWEIAAFHNTHRRLA
jgi:uncharacterized protein (TIGR02246 family)